MIFIVDLEPVETRYTAQWKSHLPALLKKAGFDVYVIEGPTDIPQATTPGAFLNFGGTNIYKAAQVETMGRLFCDGHVRSGDHFIFTDAWHPGIINLKYMSELLNIPVTTHGLWHAGSYDPHDFLGRLIGNEPWVRLAERSYYHAFDRNYFATDFHIDMFCDNLLQPGDYNERKIVLSGWPMEYMDTILDPYKGMKKRDLIVFPHRVAPEKQVEIFRDLQQQLPQYEFVVCQDQQLTKHEYHKLLGEAKVVFSASLQETLGIGCYEGAIVGAIPMVPDRLSYSEMYADDFKYPSEWTIDYATYTQNKSHVVAKIVDHVEHYESRLPVLQRQKRDLHERFFSATNIINQLRR